MDLDNNFKRKLSREGYGWHSRNLPHLDAEETAQFVTFRLADSMPQNLLDKWRAEMPSDIQFRKRIESYLDSGAGECLLSRPDIAKIVQKALLFHNEKKYKLHAWVIMPNHSHILLTQFTGEHLSSIMHSIKSYTAQKVNKLLDRKGQFWQHDSFDRYIRGWRHFNAVVKYVEDNPVKAGLCKEASEWEFGSAYYRAVDRDK